VRNGRGAEAAHAGDCGHLLGDVGGYGDVHGARVPPNDPAQARRADDVRLSTEARSRRCLQPAG
jgi:hypothetical protein